MNKALNALESLSPGQKWLLGGAVAVAVVATGGAAAYAISTGGLFLVSGETAIVLGVPAAAAASKWLG